MTLLKIDQANLVKGDTINFKRSSEHGGNLFKVLKERVIVDVYVAANGSFIVTVVSDTGQDFYSNVISFEYAKDQA